MTYPTSAPTTRPTVTAGALNLTLDRLGPSRPTVRQAIRSPVDKGLLVRRRGVGTQVVHSKVRRPPELSGLKEGAALLTMRRTAYDDTGRAVEYGTRVYRVSRYAFAFELLVRR